jgi:hypothetical protein
VVDNEVRMVVGEKKMNRYKRMMGDTKRVREENVFGEGRVVVGVGWEG